MNYEDMDKKTLIEILKDKDNMLKKICLEKEELNYFAITDCMTEALNRRFGLELLEKELNLAKINAKHLIVSFVDVDNLKIINDTFGHEEGDKVLINIVKILKESIRNRDFVIRMGGDEFLIVFPETTLEGVKKVWNRIFSKIDKINNNVENKYIFTLSYGCIEFNIEDKLSVEELINKADIEMYKMKKLKKENRKWKEFH